MSAAKHTPGPWRIVADENHAGNKRIAGGSFSAVAKVYANEPVAGDAKAEANARVIAAAPELLEALELLVSEQCICDPVAARKARDVARAAIAKARGEA